MIDDKNITHPIRSHADTKKTIFIVKFGFGVFWKNCFWTGFQYYWNTPVQLMLRCMDTSHMHTGFAGLIIYLFIWFMKWTLQLYWGNLFEQNSPPRKYWVRVVNYDTTILQIIYYNYICIFKWCCFHIKMTSTVFEFRTKWRMMMFSTID